MVKLGEPLGVDGSTTEDERFADDDSDAGDFLLGSLEEGAETCFIGFDGSFVSAVEFVPDVVDANEDAEDVGLDIDGVLFPAFVEVGNFVA